jgi:hypothetical protein
MAGIRAARGIARRPEPIIYGEPPEEWDQAYRKAAEKAPKEVGMSP